MLCGALFVTGAFFIVREVQARSMVATGSLNVDSLVKAKSEKFKNKLRGEGYFFTGTEYSESSINSMTLQVSDENQVSGWGKISTYEVLYYGGQNGKKSEGPVGGTEGEYSIVLSGAYKRGGSLGGEAVIRFFSQWSESGARTHRTNWNGVVKGNFIEGKIVNFDEGRDVSFTLSLGESAEVTMDEEIKAELETELDKSGVVVTGDPEDREEWEAELLGVNNAYVIVDGVKKELTNGMVLEPGMEIETEGDDGLAVFTTSTGEHIRLQGNSKVTLMTTEIVEDKEWKEILDQYTRRGVESLSGSRQAGKEEFKQRRPVTVMQAGQMVVKYESGGRKGWWNAAFKKDYDVDSEGSAVGFAGGLKVDPVSGKERQEPVQMIVENYSEVEYVHNGEKVDIKVNEGEVVVYRIDLEIKENVELGKISSGEKAELDLVKFEIISKQVFEKIGWWGKMVSFIKGLLGK